MDIRRKNKISTEAGMSSMTDLVFLMLIFFIIMSTMMEKNIPVDLPSTKSDMKSSKVRPPVIIGINADGKYFFGEDLSKLYDFDQAQVVLESKMAENNEKTLKISGDRNTNYEAVLKIIALAKSKDWKPVLAYKEG